MRVRIRELHFSVGDHRESRSSRALSRKYWRRCASYYFRNVNKASLFLNSEGGYGDCKMDMLLNNVLELIYIYCIMLI